MGVFCTYTPEVLISNREIKKKIIIMTENWGDFKNLKIYQSTSYTD